jgi:hypothetical protein
LGGNPPTRPPIRPTNQTCARAGARAPTTVLESAAEPPPHPKGPQPGQPRPNRPPPGGPPTGKMTFLRQLFTLALFPLISPGVRVRPVTYLRRVGGGEAGEEGRAGR